MLFYAAALQTLNYDWDTLDTEPFWLKGFYARKIDRGARAKRRQATRVFHG